MDSLRGDIIEPVVGVCDVVKRFVITPYDRGLFLTGISVDTDRDADIFAVVRNDKGYNDVRETVRSFNSTLYADVSGADTEFQLKIKGRGKSLQLYMGTEWMMPEERADAAVFLVKALSVLSFANEDMNEFISCCSDIFSSGDLHGKIRTLSIVGDRESAVLRLKTEADSEEQLRMIYAVLSDLTLPHGAGIVKNPEK